jgi:hypothetical protein
MLWMLNTMLCHAVLCRERYQTPEQIATIWKDYFFFGFIRNPWARAYSLYKDMTATNHFLHKHGPRCQMEWGRFCRDPFQEFDRLYGSGCSHKAPHYAYWHMMDQYHCMITPTGEWAVDFLGQVERGNEDWRVIVDEMNKRRLPGVPEVVWSDLDHAHKVEPGQKPRGSQQQQEQQQQQQQEQQQQQQQQQRPVHTRHLERQLLAEQQQREQQPPQHHQQQPPEQQSHVVRLFRHLWRRIRLATAAANEDDAEADGEVDDYATAAVGSSPNPDREGALGPYSGSNEHCIDAVSQWFACDIEKFGYLPPSPDAAAEAAGTNDTAGTDNSSSTVAPSTTLPQPAAARAPAAAAVPTAQQQ